MTCLYRVAHHTGGRSFSVSPVAGALLVYSVTLLELVGGRAGLPASAQGGVHRTTGQARYLHHLESIHAAGPGSHSLKNQRPEGR